MAVVAVVATRNMYCMLPGRSSSVMTGSTGSEDMCVVKRSCRIKSECAVAVFADVACLNMCRALARGSVAIVARNAIAVITGVIKSCRQPARRAVAVVALIVARNMAGSFSRRLCAIVAIDTGTSE